MRHRIREQAHSHRFCIRPLARDLGTRSAARASLLILIPQQPRHHKTRLGCRLNAGDAEWVERHGCRESAVRTWMSVRRGPTERRRSEGTRRSRAQPRAKPLVTWGYQVTRRRRNSLDVRTNQTLSVTPNSENARHISRLLQVMRRRERDFRHIPTQTACTINLMVYHQTKYKPHEQSNQEPGSPS
jgi:hypothetical protein